MLPSAIETFINNYYLFLRSIVYVFGLLLIYFSYPLFNFFFFNAIQVGHNPGPEYVGA